MFKISKLNRVKKSNIMRDCLVSIVKVIYETTDSD